MEKNKIIKIEEFLLKKEESAPKGKINEWVSEISKDEFTVFKLKKGLKEMNKLYINGRYDFDNNDEEGEMG